MSNGQDYENLKFLIAFSVNEPFAIFENAH